MHRSEDFDLTRCASCGVEIHVDVDRAFTITPESALCYDCAVQRGGTYDEVHDRWLRGPDVSDVAVDLG